jgi:Holliday junction resolvase
VGVGASNARGREFETEIAGLFLACGFEVVPNAKSARPRQTDIFVRGDSFDLLVEAKNQRRKVDVGDIDDLRARLARVSPDIVGAIFTTTGLTKNAIEAIESNRTREILAFVKEEIDEVRAGHQNLKTLIDRKRSALRVHGKIWFGSTKHSEFVDVPLPRGGVEFRIGSSIQSYFESKSGFSGPSYSLQIPDSGWGSVGGEGARICL